MNALFQQQPETAKDKARRIAVQGLGFIQELEKSAAFAWFVEQFVTPAVTEARESALNISLSKDQRDTAAHVHDALKTKIADALETRKNVYIAELQKS